MGTGRQFGRLAVGGGVFRSTDIGRVDHCRLKHLAMRHTIMGKTMTMEDTMNVSLGKDAVAWVVG